MALEMENMQDQSRSDRKLKSKAVQMNEYLGSFAESFGEGVILLNNTLYLDTMILSNKNIAKNLIRSGNEKIALQVSELLLLPMDYFIDFVDQNIKKTKADFKPPVFPDKLPILGIFNETWNRISDLKNEFSEELAIPQSIYVEEGVLRFSDYTSFISNLKKTSTYYIDTLLILKSQVVWKGRSGFGQHL